MYVYRIEIDSKWQISVLSKLSRPAEHNRINNWMKWNGMECFVVIFCCFDFLPPRILMIDSFLDSNQSILDDVWDHKKNEKILIVMFYLFSLALWDRSKIQHSKWMNYECICFCLLIWLCGAINDLIKMRDSV